VLVAARIEMAQVGGEAAQHAQLLQAKIGAGQMAAAITRVGRLD
jgi:hypothetical protein